MWALAVGGVASLLCAKLWADGQAGSDLAAAGSVPVAWIGLKSLHQAAIAYGERRHLRGLKQQAKASAKRAGNARLAERRDLKAAGLLTPGGAFVGAHDGRDLFNSGENHQMTIASPGSGKGTCQVIPTLLSGVRDRAHGNRLQSIVVNDIKGELYATCAKFLRKLGYRVVTIAPWADKLSAELGIEITDAGFNPLSVVKPGPNVKDEAEMIAALLLPGTATDNSSAEFFNLGGRSLLVFGILVLVATRPPEERTLPALRKLLLSPPAEMEKMLAVAAESDDFSGVLREYAGKLIGTMTHAPEEFSGVLSTAQKALAIYDAHSPLGISSSKNGVDFVEIKKQPTVVFVIYPSDRLASHAPGLNLTFSTAFECVGRDRSSRRVLFLLDEFANAGYLPNVLRAMALYRAQGVIIWTVIQQISQLQRLYGEGSMREFLGMSALTSVFGVWESETLRVLSEMTGQQGHRDVSHSIRPDGSGNDDASFSAGTTTRPVIRPDEIRTLPNNKQLVFYRNAPTIVADLVDYRSRRTWRWRASPNPYYRKG